MEMRSLGWAPILSDSVSTKGGMWRHTHGEERRAKIKTETGGNATGGRQITRRRLTEQRLPRSLRKNQACDTRP